MSTQAKSPFPAGFTITTPRLRIIPLDPGNQEHCEFLVHLWGTELFTKHLGPSGINDAATAKKFISNRVLADYERNKHGLFLVLLYNEETKQTTPIGTASLMKGAPPGAHYLLPDVGFVTLPELNGKGYATEATKGLIEYATKDLGIDGVFGFTGPDNIASRRVLEKAGLEFRGIAELVVFGRLSAIYTLPGMSQDLSVYGLSEEIQKEEVAADK
ncbi:hypothetical protein N7478_006699 [Penicillium angulare]|uniref:uncharacterized protein n=1 Tax=Penicillium angulare TaxID=116970 RepID=UPI0025421193|nr:uncharacterized protein N7478_006699 [Penicillium angulare]KAJ5281327.1 hypothetical protein N7478_006699 [Penicillium angulare]